MILYAELRSLAALGKELGMSLAELGELGEATVARLAIVHRAWRKVDDEELERQLDAMKNR